MKRLRILVLLALVVVATTASFASSCEAFLCGIFPDSEFCLNGPIE